MLYALSFVLLPPLLVFALYHLNLWMRLPGMRGRVFWRRVAFASAQAHLLILAGFVFLVWLDYRTGFPSPTGSFGGYMATSPDVAGALWVLDPVAMAVVTGLAGVVSGIRVGAGVLVLLLTIVVAVGTLQWYWVGGGLAAVFERIWGELRTEGDDLPNWF